MQQVLSNWKTTLAGVAAILGALADVAHQASVGTFDPNHLMADWTAIVAGIGLIAARDANK
jgi:hypothetical protein